VVKGKPRALASRIQFGLPQVGAGLLKEVGYCVLQMGQPIIVDLVSFFLAINFLLSDGKIDRFGVVVLRLVCLVFSDRVLPTRGSR